MDFAGQPFYSGACYEGTDDGRVTIRAGIGGRILFGFSFSVGTAFKWAGAFIN